MNSIIRWYNANRSAILKIAGAFIAVFLMIKLVNGISHQTSNTPRPNIQSNEKITNTIRMESNSSAVSGQKLSASQKDSLKTLDKFANYCNAGDIDKAYDLVSEDCKKEMYTTKELFVTAYYNPVFEGKKKDVSVENWIGNIYKVNFKEDPLTTGIIEDKNTKLDYITILEDENGNQKLNINGYIRKEELNVSNRINVTEGNDSVVIKAVETNIYMDYQTITYEITNNSNRTILLNDPKLNSKMYIEDSNGIKYQAYTHEIAPSQLKVRPNEKKMLTVKYYSRFTSSKEIRSIVFARIILNYDAYSNYQDTAYYNNYGTMQINL